MSLRIVVLTGAGISAESGIRTFRADDGLWEEHRVEDVATPEGYRKDPALVHRFYNERRVQVLAAQPNRAHLALAACQERLAQAGGELFLVTQNIDDLHERGGSRQALHMHGEILQMRCERTERVHPETGSTSPQSLCPCCKSPGLLRPHIVWFGEMPFGMEEIHHKLSRAQLFVSIGTSGNVYPAAGFFSIAQRFGAKTVELNLEASQNARQFNERDYGPATEVVPRFFDKL